MNKTSWSFVSLGMTLAGAAIAFYVWNDFWRAAIIGLIAGAAVRTMQVLVSQQVTWASAVGWFVATAVAALAAVGTYAAWGEFWLAVLVALVTAGIIGPLVAVLIWIIEPTPLDMDAMLGTPDDIWWKLRDTRWWQHLSRWVERRSAAHAR
jgi:hypothetical protein